MAKHFFKTLLTGASLLSTPAMALDFCQSSIQDAQMKTCTYSAGQRYAIFGIVNYVINFKVRNSETLKRVEFAYTGKDKDGMPAAAWRGPKTKEGADAPVDKYKTNLPVWPFKEGQSSMLIVTSLPDGSERSYPFVLYAQSAEVDCDKNKTGAGCIGDIKTASSVTFAYPEDDAKADAEAKEAKRKAAVAAWQTKKAKDDEQAAIARMKVDVFYGQQNWNYSAKGDPKYAYLAPSKISDNGMLTEMQWPGNVQIPAVSIGKCNDHDNEHVPPITQQDHMIIIPTTAEVFCVHLGQKPVLEIYNKAWSPNRPDPGTGTTSPDVVRDLLYKASK